MTAIRWRAADLRRSLVDLLGTHSKNTQLVEDTVDATITASLCGVDTHGISLIPKIIARSVSGRTQLEESPEELNGSERHDLAISSFDAKLCPGQHATLVATRRAIDKAKRFGIGYTTVRNSTHFGCCTPFLRLIADEGCAGLVGSNSLRSLAAFGLKRANLGNNPFGFVSPRNGKDHFLFDFSCAVMSYGRKAQLTAAGKPLPPEAFIEPTGVPDESGVCEIADSLDLVALPFGGFKGASVAIAIEFLSGILGGGAFGKDTETIDKDGRFLGACHFVLAINPKVFPIDSFETEAERFLDEIRRDQSDLRIPGDNAAMHFKERTELGIPVSKKLSSNLKALFEERHVSPPANV